MKKAALRKDGLKRKMPHICGVGYSVCWDQLTVRGEAPVKTATVCHVWLALGGDYNDQQADEKDRT